MTNFKKSVRDGCPVLRSSLPPPICPWNSHLKFFPWLARGNWFFGTLVHLLPRTASFLSKAIFPCTQHLSLSIGFLSNKQPNLSSATEGRKDQAMVIKSEKLELVWFSHGKKTCTRGYPSESIPTLTGNIWVDWIWIRVWVFLDNQKSDTGTGMRLLHLPRPQTWTRPAT